MDRVGRVVKEGLTVGRATAARSVAAKEASRKASFHRRGVGEGNVPREAGEFGEGNGARASDGKDFAP